METQVEVCRCASTPGEYLEKRSSQPKALFFSLLRSFSIQFVARTSHLDFSLPICFRFIFLEDISFFGTNADLTQLLQTQYNLSTFMRFNPLKNEILIKQIHVFELIISDVKKKKKNDTDPVFD